MKRMLITGATGSLGTELLSHYYPNYQIYAHGRDAQRLLGLKMRFPRIDMVLGDLRCHGLHEAIRACDVVIHAAAQKYVDLAERHCFFTVDTNVACTHELAELAATEGVKRFVLISTDKASDPRNVYGVTKYLAERLILELAGIFTATTFTICRFGNIFGSNGSVVRLWLEALRRGGTLQVTDPDMTRFMFSVEEAVATVDYALTKAQTGDILIRKMCGVALQEIIDLFPGAPVKVVGKRPGEKLHETLYVQGEINTGYETDDYYVLNRSSSAVLPMVSIDSSQVSRVAPQQLRRWFDRVRKQAA